MRWAGVWWSGERPAVGGVVRAGLSVRAHVAQVRPGDAPLNSRWRELHTGLGLRITDGMGPSMVGLPADRLLDLVGHRVMQVLRHVGWRFSSSAGMRCAFIEDRGRLVAAGWSTPAMRSDGAFGFNGSYLVAPAYEGRGLAKLCAGVAFIAAYEAAQAAVGHGITAAGLANARAWVQTRRDNPRALGLAVAQGFEPDEGLSFKCQVDSMHRGREDLDFAGLSQPAASYLEVAAGLLMDRLVPQEQ